jgi:phage baseplate assembly protein W
MGFVFESSNTSTTDSIKNDIGLGISLASETKLFSTLYDISKQGKENLKALLLTQVGERYMLPTFGCNFLDIIFQPNVNELKEEIADIIQRAVNVWLPYIVFDELKIKTAEDDPTMGESVEIVLSFHVENFNTQSITIMINDSALTVS